MEIAWSDEDYQLMAAAPDLLKAVHAALSYVVGIGNLRDGSEASQLQRTLRAAISKTKERHV
jgi:hypothetical protein